MTEKLVVRNLYKIFGDRPGPALEMLQQGLDKDEIFRRTGLVVGVQDASFSINEGEIFVVMGLSGSGKSTIVRMLNRLIEPTAGSVIIDGQDVAQMDKRTLTALRRRDMSMVFQSFALMPHLSVLDNAAFGLEVAGVDRRERHALAMQALERVGLGANARSLPEELSGGMQQRVGLARALAANPSVMLMDEAFSALDPLIRTEMQDELLRLQREARRTIVFISHDLDEALRIGDRIAIMKGGRVVQVGTAEEIVRNPADDYVRSFFKSVDVTHFLTAQDLATRDGQATLRAGIDCAAALAELREAGSDYACVIDAEGRYRGTLSVGSLLRAQDGGQLSLERAYLDGAEAVEGRTHIDEVVSRVAEAAYPLAVIDAAGRYQGAVSKSALLHKLREAK